VPPAEVPPDGTRADRVAALVAGVADCGYAIVPDFLAAAATAALRARAQAAFAAQRMQPAAVGRADARVRDASVRGDAIAWLDDAPTEAAERALLATLDDIRRAVNAALFLGLFDFEGHYARYPEGACYARHRDRFRDQDTRTLSFVLYLNERWPEDAGGALRLYVDDAHSIDVVPREGSAVAFLADRFEHEVLPATCPRWSFTGWFRRRPR
jgi:SM-20-related protein